MGLKLEAAKPLTALFVKKIDAEIVQALAPFWAPKLTKSFSVRFFSHEEGRGRNRSGSPCVSFSHIASASSLNLGNHLSQSNGEYSLCAARHKLEKNSRACVTSRTSTVLAVVENLEDSPI